MEFEDRLDEFKTIFHRSALPDEVRQNYEQILAFMDAREGVDRIANFSAHLAALLESNLDLLFPVPDNEEKMAPLGELLDDRRYEEVQEMIRRHEQVEGDVKEAILDRIPGEGDETLCLFPTPFLLTADEATDPGVLGDLVVSLLGQYDHPTLLVRQEPHQPPELFEHVVVVGSSLHDILRLIRCTAGICPEDTEIKVIAVADHRFITSMKKLLKESTDFEKKKTESKLRETLLQELRRKLRQLGDRLSEEFDIILEHRVFENTLEEATEQTDFFQSDPSLLSVPLHHEDGGYDLSVLRPLFERHTETEILTV